MYNTPLIQNNPSSPKLPPRPLSNCFLNTHFIFLPPPPPPPGSTVSSAAVEPVIANTNWYRRLSPQERVHGQGTSRGCYASCQPLFTFHLNIFLSPIPGLYVFSSPRLLFCVITEWVIFPPPTVFSSTAARQLIWLFMFPLHHSSPLGRTVMRQGLLFYSVSCEFWVCVQSVKAQGCYYFFFLGNHDDFQCRTADFFPLSYFCCCWMPLYSNGLAERKRRQPMCCFLAVRK